MASTVTETTDILDSITKALNDGLSEEAKEVIASGLTVNLVVIESTRKVVAEMIKEQLHR